MANPDAPWGKNYGYRFKPSVDDDLMANSEAVTESPMYAAHPGYKYGRYGKRSADAKPETEANTVIPQSYYGYPFAYDREDLNQDGRYGKRSTDAKPETEANTVIPQSYYGYPFAYDIHQDGLIGKCSADAEPETDAKKPRYYYGRPY
jgi:hypothetical protein